MIKKSIFNILVAAFFVQSVVAQISGRVTDATTGEPLAGAVVQWHDGAGVTTNSRGNYTISGLQSGSYTFTASFLGYAPRQQKLDVNQNGNYSLDFSLDPVAFTADPVVITATRTQNRVLDVPARINLIAPAQLANIPATTTDELLTYVPGLQISRSFGPISARSTVSMRGMSGKEQSRTLVLFDGIPINKTDGGSVNWNLLNTDQIEQIEVIKGPGSALYGGSAMGGIVNIVTRRPQKLIEGKVAAEYATFNTPGARLSLSGRMNQPDSSGFYWMVNGFARRSDGYVVQPPADQTRYTTPSAMSEIMGGIRLGYDFNANRNIELDVKLYDDRRTAGEEVFQPDGNATDHDTRHFRLSYSDKQGETTYNATLFALVENYHKVNEWMSGDMYTFYDVDSKRSDYGLLVNATRLLLSNHRVTAGIDLRQGAVDASDIYYTSTDKINNRGRMNFGAVYLQDEYAFAKGNGRVVAGLRLDYAHFYDGAFTIEYPSVVNSFMAPYQIEAIDNTTWTALSPKLGVQYKPTNASRVYAGYSRGFRPSILDDMCRSGRIRGGFKIANPNLKPETIDNFELGGDLNPFSWARLAASVYYSLGHDFMYYTSTGQTIDMGYAVNPISRRENISQVEIYGVEAELSVRPIEYLTFFANYAYTHSQIKDYTVVNPLVDFDLTGKFLTDVAPHIFSAGAVYSMPRFSVSALCKYTDKMWITDSNGFDDKYLFAYQYPSVFQVDARAKLMVINGLWVAGSVQNLFDVKYYESKGSVSPGRYITAEVSYSF
ncbi:MAG: TonB-dependent receptor [Bacteroidales bacterium]|nr:TonB-dependent receptor [Bacteroidales bacterium]MDD3664507.1 TonB-dependent receptor [Bacteroidales bacterium]